MTDLENIEGLFVGQLRADELKLFEQAIADGTASRVYSGAAGFLGLAKVQLIRSKSSIDILPDRR